MKKVKTFMVISVNFPRYRKRQKYLTYKSNGKIRFLTEPTISQVDLKYFPLNFNLKHF